MRTVLIFVIRAYQLMLGAWLGGHCRFQPSCSSYGIEAVKKHGCLRGLWMAAARIAKCHPLHAGGLDPVP